jgi:hypothetical protein
MLVNTRYFGWDNSYIVRCLKNHPKLLLAHGLLEPQDPASSPDD